MKIEQLKYVLELERSKSINRASKKLYITQQSLSYQIRSLEDELGFSIIDRYQRGSVLTEKGVLFAEFCRNFINEWDILQEKINDLDNFVTNDVISGKLTLYSNKEFEQFVLPEILGGFIAKYPTIKVRTVLLDVNEADEIDFRENFIWFVNLPKTSNEIIMEPYIDERFDFHSLYHGKYVLCASNRGKVTKQKKTKLETILKYPIVCHNISSRNDSEGQNDSILIANIKTHGEFNINITAQTDNYGALLDMIALGMGAGFIYDRVWDKLKQQYPKKQYNISVLDIKEYLGYVSGCAVRKENLTTVEKVFLDYMNDNFNEDSCFH